MQCFIVDCTAVLEKSISTITTTFLERRRRKGKRMVARLETNLYNVMRLLRTFGILRQVADA
jgi:hypothetical protein